MVLPTLASWGRGDAVTSAKLQADPDALAWLLYKAYGTYSQTTSAQSVANDTDVALVLNSIIRANKVTHSTVTNNSRITPNEPGLYLVTAVVQFGADATGYRKLWFRQNGTGTEGSVQTSASGSGETSIGMTSLLYFNGATDYVEVMIRQNRGSALLLGFGEFNPRVSLMWQSGLV